MSKIDIPPIQRLRLTVTSCSGARFRSACRMQAMLLLITATALLTVSCSSSKSNQIVRTAYVNANVFDGERFHAGAIVVEGSTIVAAAPSTATESIDLQGGYLVPPFCEAHNHNLGDADRNDETISQYLSEGIFYVGILSNLPALTEKVRHTYNNPNSVDVMFANAPLTATGGHPIRLREVLLDRGFYPGFTRETLPGQGYVVIDNESDLEREWPAILKTRPDLIKIMLVNSEEFALRRDRAEFFGAKGLDPELVRPIVARAHATKLRVVAHIESPHDFHVAVASGVDLIAHLGGVNQPTRLDPADAALAAKRVSW